MLISNEKETSMKELITWLSEVLAEPRKSLPFSLAANMLLIIVLFSGYFVTITWTREEGLRMERNLESLVKTLFHNGTTRAQVASLLIDGLQSLQKADTVAAAMRQWSQESQKPFDPLWQDHVNVSLSDSSPEGMVAFCEGKEQLTERLRGLYLFVMVPVPAEGHQQTYRQDALDTPLNIMERISPCMPSGHFQIQISRGDWAKLFGAPSQPVAPNAQHTTDVTVAIYLHVPYPNTRSIVGAHQDNAASPRAEATHARM